jgi:hypothetical protein
LGPDIVVRRFVCPYVSDGHAYTVTIEAFNAAEAADKLSRLPWAPGNGPTAEPFPEGAHAPNAKQRAANGDATSALIVLILIYALMTISVIAPFFSVWVTADK